MEFLKNNKRFSFLYGGKSIWEFDMKTTSKEEKDGIIFEYLLDDGLKITNIAKKYSDFDAYEWVTWFENTGSKPTKIISELWDCNCEIPFEHDEPKQWTAYLSDPEKSMKIYAPKGATWSVDEFQCKVDDIQCNIFPYYLFPSEVKEYKNVGGRSSDGQAPFFNVFRQGKGFIAAIGWTGQWNSRFERTDGGVTIKTKIEDTHFYLKLGEKIRTSSIVIMTYEGTVVESHNKWRRLVKKEFSLIGKEGRDNKAPFCAEIWGGMSDKSVLDRIEKIDKNDLPFEYIWMDAGWYGMGQKPSPDEFEGDWGEHTGDWRVNPYLHPNGLKDVSKAVCDGNRKFLLWFEPERVVSKAPICEEHPEYLLKSKENSRDLLLNLGNEEAWEYCFKTISGIVEELNLSCYRQDFNFQPLEYWRNNDTDDRQGISEIKHIMGMYRLWDALLEKFPHLLIDDCASGGRRIDIETMRRSVPLWRSDAYCPANWRCEYGQNHNMAYSAWIPYSGTASGREWGDVYRIRSAYAGALTVSYTFSERDIFGEDNKQIEWIKKYAKEYLKVRPYFYEDVYPLTEPSPNLDVWSAIQFNDPERKAE